MSDTDEQQVGKTLWSIADALRGEMNTCDFRDRPARDAPAGWPVPGPLLRI